MTEEIDGWRERCEWCRVRSKEFPTPRMTMPVDMEHSFSSWVADQIELTPVRGNPGDRAAGRWRGVFIFVNCGSRFVVLVPVKTFSSKSFEHAVGEVYGVFGKISRLVTDAGPYFTAREMQKLLKGRVTSLVTVAPKNHKAVGLVEKRVQITKRVLQNVMLGAVRWEDRIKDVNVILNRKYCRVTGRTAMELMFPCSDRIPFSVTERESMRRYVSDRQWESEDAEWTDDELDAVEMMMMSRRRDAQLREQVLFRKARLREVANGVPPNYEFVIGDLVLARREVSALDKSGIQFMGPYEVAEVDETLGRYVIVPVAEHLRHIRLERSGDQLKRASGSQDEIFISMRSGEGPHGEVYMDRIIADALFEGPKKLERWFRVRWSGFGEKDDSWVTWDELEGTRALATYIESHKRLQPDVRNTIEGDVSIHEQIASIADPSLRSELEQRQALDDEDDRNGGLAGESDARQAKKTADAEEAERKKSRRKTNGRKRKRSVMNEMNESMTGDDEHEMEVAAEAGEVRIDDARAIARNRRGSVVIKRQRVKITGMRWPQGVTLDRAAVEEAGLAEDIARVSREPSMDECELCGIGGSVMSCSLCVRSYHIQCVGIARKVAREVEWVCPECSEDLWPPEIDDVEL
jgi:hypothetical protein